MEFDLDWIMSHANQPYYYPTLAALAGLTSHVIYNRFEPTVFKVLAHWSAASVALLTTLLFSANFPLTTALLITLQCQLVYLLTLGTSITLYRLSPFHPLAKYPGPVLAKITALYWGRRVANMTPRFDLVDLHKKYGDFVRIGPNALSVLNTDAISPLYGAKGWPKGPEYCQAGVKNPNPAHASLHLLRSHDLHTQRRKTWDKGFSASALASYHPIVYSAASRMVEALDKQIALGGKVNLHKWTGFYSFDVMRALAFGDSDSFLTDGEDAHGILHELHVSTDETGLGMSVPWLLEFIAEFPFMSNAIEFRKYVISKYTQRRSQGQALLNIKDVFHYLLMEDVDTHAQPSDEQLANDATLIIVAGSDTTHLTMTLAITYLLSNPDIYREFQKEIDDVLMAKGNVLAIADLEKLPILNGVINETLRLQPPVAQGLVRRSPRAGGMVCGQFVPEGTATRVPVYAIQRDAQAFSVKPNEFRPKRWYAPEKGEIVNKTAFIPFSVGPYSCIGRVLALHELRIGLAAFFLKYNARFAPGFDMQSVNMGDRFLVNLTTEIPLTLTKREGVSIEYPSLL